MRAFAALCSIVALALALSARAQVSGPEFRVNEAIEGIQRDPVVAAADDGSTVVAWTRVGIGENAEDVFFRLFDPNGNPRGPDIRAHSDVLRGQFRPAVAMAPDGRFVVAWTSHEEPGMLEVHARRFMSEGSPAADVFTVNTTPDSSQANPAVAMDGAGNFCVVWHSWFQDGGDRGVYGRCYLADGTARGGEFAINQTTAFSQANPSISMAGDGRFAVVRDSWNDDGAGTAEYDVYARVFDATGLPAGDEFRVNQETADDQWQADVSMNDDGGFVVAWTSWEQDGDDGAVMAREFDEIGLARSDEIQVNVTSEGYQWLPSVVALGRNGFAVAWSSWKEDGDREGVYMRWYQPVGQNAARINNVTSGFQWEPSAVRVNEFGAWVVWSSWGQESSDYDILAESVAFFPVAVEEEVLLPSVELSPAFPNPFQDRTSISFSLREPADVRLEVVDVLGRTVRILDRGHQPPGAHDVQWDGRDTSGRATASGVYLCRLRVGAQTRTRALVRL